MIDAVLTQPMPSVERHHVRMSYSHDMEEVGRFRVKKLFSVIGRVLWVLARIRPHVVL